MKANQKDFNDLREFSEEMQQQLKSQKEQTNIKERLCRSQGKEIDRLNFEFKKLKYMNEQLERKISINDNSEHIQHVINELSGLMLSDSTSVNISSQQIGIVKQIFGDVATQAYKNKIKLLEENLNSKIKE